MKVENLKLELNHAIKNKDIEKINSIFEIFPTIDIAEIVDELKDITDVVYIFRVVKSSYTAELFKDLSNAKQEELINSFLDKDIIKILSSAFADDVTDYLSEMPANLVSRILKVAPKDMREDINHLLNYKDNTAGSIMTTEFLMFDENETIKSTISKIKEKGKQAVTIYTIFIRDSLRNLVGTVDLDELLFNDTSKPLKEIMNKKFQTVDVNLDQEEVAKLFKRYDLTAIAVLNSDKKICGIITADDIFDVITEEAAEDISNISNVSKIDKPYLETPIMKLVLKCAPWIVVLMILQVFSSMILSSFQSEINKFAILSVFSPMILDASGNSGGQTTGLMIRSLGLDEIHRGDWKKVALKEFLVGTIVGLIVSVFAFGWAMLEMSTGLVSCHIEDYPAIQGVSNDTILHLVVAGLVGITLLISIVLSKLFGVGLSFIAYKLKKDPAVMAQPLVTTLVDISSLLIYFGVWMLFFEYFLGI